MKLRHTAPNELGQARFPARWIARGVDRQDMSRALIVARQIDPPLLRKMGAVAEGA